ncbi:serine hydrolase domain-containing protein [Goodfellowiella coeruleoviolacea]|uniref:D-alanyl-D-alanine carboxypeptidase n=1 Tax=Goodfellowiella coeruleoviolacea TaxID=334858 RepID=A0AAE3KE10_9PSEU|nr:serine hydrolase domain-containing protein [Goodfellowiella coeruleoviolacea]MCP2164766.1 D-alanyl-D-alanine carboxypeptidase [Goodfellowiella coeruleoviolacea]
MHVPGRRRRGLLVLTGLAAILLAASTGLTAAATPQHADSLQQQVDAIHDTGVVGVLAEVTSPGTRDSARAGTAGLGAGRPMPRDGRFRIGSATKTFTAAVVLQLVGEGRMSLEDTVERWLPGVVQGNGNDGSQITVRQLLQHTSHVPEVLPEIPALTSAEGYRVERFRSYTPAELVGLAMRHSPTTDTDWSYSNTNYVLAAMIIHEVTGRSWAQEVTDRIIRPLGLTDTSTTGIVPSPFGSYAHAYATFGTDTSIDVTVLNPSMAIGSGSITSTTHDLNRFYAALLGGRLLAPAQLAEMTTTMPTPELGTGYGYGLGLGEIPLPCGGSYFGHPGELLGYRTWGGVTRDGTRTAVVYATSSGGKDTQQAMSALVGQQLCATRS